MTISIFTDKWRLYGLIAFCSIALPLGFVFYILLTTDQESVVFLDGYPASVGICIILYYLLLLGIGMVWLIKRIFAIFALRKETMQQEMRHLQSQINPHFFFNILNSLYGLIGKDQAQAQDLVLKLSDMMRYSIYDGQKESVSIEEEVAFIENYIELHQMRYHKDIEIQFDQNIADGSLQIMPLMLIVLVENAFKHGVERLRKHPFVKLKLEVSTDGLHFEVSNNFDPEAPQKELGMGIQNLRRRLNLKYPKEHKLELQQLANVHQAKLKITAL